MSPAAVPIGDQNLVTRSVMLKRIAVFAALVLGYALTGVALNAGDFGRTGAPVAMAAE